MPSPPISIPTSTLLSILYITSFVSVSSPVIGPVIAQTVLPATGVPFEIKDDSGHVPVSTVLVTPPVPEVPPVGSLNEPSSPGETIDVSPPPPQDMSINVDKTKVVFLKELKNIIGTSQEYMAIFKSIWVTVD